MGWATSLLACPGTWQLSLLVLLKSMAGSAETRFVNSDYIWSLLQMRSDLFRLYDHAFVHSSAWAWP